MSYASLYNASPHNEGKKSEKKTHEEAKEEEKNAKLFKSRQTLARTPTIYYSEKYQ